MKKECVFAPVMVFPVRRRLMGWTIASVRSICGAHHRIFCKMVCFHMRSFDFAGDFPFSASEERIFTGMHGHVLRW